MNSQPLLSLLTGGLLVAWTEEICLLGLPVLAWVMGSSGLAYLMEVGWGACAFNLRKGKLFIQARSRTLCWLLRLAVNLLKHKKQEIEQAWMTSWIAARKELKLKGGHIAGGLGCVSWPHARTVPERAPLPSDNGSGPCSCPWDLLFIVLGSDREWEKRALDGWGRQGSKALLSEFPSSTYWAAVRCQGLV